MTQKRSWIILVALNLGVASVNLTVLVAELWHHQWTDAAMPFAAVSIGIVVSFGLRRAALILDEANDQFSRATEIHKLIREFYTERNGVK